MQTRLAKAGGQLAFQPVRCPSSEKVSTKHCCAIVPVIVLASNLWFLDVDDCAFENLIVCVLRAPLSFSQGAVTRAKKDGVNPILRQLTRPPCKPPCSKACSKARKKYDHVLHGDCGLLLDAVGCPLSSVVNTYPNSRNFDGNNRAPQPPGLRIPVGPPGPPPEDGDWHTSGAPREPVRLRFS